MVSGGKAPADWRTPGRFACAAGHRNFAPASWSAVALYRSCARCAQDTRKSTRNSFLAVVPSDLQINKVHQAESWKFVSLCSEAAFWVFVDSTNSVCTAGGTNRRETKRKPICADEISLSWNISRQFIIYLCPFSFCLTNLPQVVNANIFTCNSISPIYVRDYNRRHEKK